MLKILLTGGDIMAQNQYNKNSYNKLVVPGAQAAIDQMKYEIASELGVTLGPDCTARENGSVGGEITRRLVNMAQQKMGRTTPSQRSRKTTTTKAKKK